MKQLQFSRCVPVHVFVGEKHDEVYKSTFLFYVKLLYIEAIHTKITAMHCVIYMEEMENTV